MGFGLSIFVKATSNNCQSILNMSQEVAHIQKNEQFLLKLYFESEYNNSIQNTFNVLTKPITKCY